MNVVPTGQGLRKDTRLSPEKVAYWYFRLNGFLQIENFVVHPGGRGGQRTDADLLGVRFPHRSEFSIDHPDRPMVDDAAVLGLSIDLIDIVIAEVKTNACCTLNGPWTSVESQNVHRILVAVGCLPGDRIAAAAADIYATGQHIADGLRIRLIAMGRERNEPLGEQFPAVVQLTWVQVLSFVGQRFNAYRHQKRQVDQWDVQGRRLKAISDFHQGDIGGFVADALQRLGVRK